MRSGSLEGDCTRDDDSDRRPLGSKLLITARVPSFGFSAQVVFDLVVVVLLLLLSPLVNPPCALDACSSVSCALVKCMCDHRPAELKMDGLVDAFPKRALYSS